MMTDETTAGTMNSFIDVRNRLIEDEILLPGQFESVKEDGFLIHIDEKYVINVSDDAVYLLRNYGNPLRRKELHTHQRDDCLYEDTYEIVKRYSEKPEAIFKREAISQIKQIIIAIILAVLIYSIYKLATQGH